MIIAVSTRCVAATTGEAPLQWRLPNTATVQWRGMLPTEGGAVGMGPQVGLYGSGGGGLAGALGALVAHGIISQTARAAANRQAQEAADSVLAPYADKINVWPSSALWELAVAAAPPTLGIKLWDGKSPADGGPSIETAPTFALSLDESVLVLDVVVKLISTTGAAPVERNTRVISTPLGSVNPREYWGDNDARQLKATAAAMLAHAIEISVRLAQFPSEESVPMRTHRYMQGAIERFERAQLLAGDCGRLKLRNLRGWVISVPIKTESLDVCTRKTTF